MLVHVVCAWRIYFFGCFLCDAASRTSSRDCKVAENSLCFLYMPCSSLACSVLFLVFVSCCRFCCCCCCVFFGQSSSSPDFLSCWLSVISCYTNPCCCVFHSSFPLFILLWWIFNRLQRLMQQGRQNQVAPPRGVAAYFFLAQWIWWSLPWRTVNVRFSLFWLALEVPISAATPSRIPMC